MFTLTRAFGMSVFAMRAAATGQRCVERAIHPREVGYRGVSLIAATVDGKPLATVVRLPALSMREIRPVLPPLYGPTGGMTCVHLPTGGGCATSAGLCHVQRAVRTEFDVRGDPEVP